MTQQQILQHLLCGWGRSQLRDELYGLKSASSINGWARTTLTQNGLAPAEGAWFLRMLLPASRGKGRRDFRSGGTESISLFHIGQEGPVEAGERRGAGSRLASHASRARLSTPISDTRWGEQMVNCSRHASNLHVGAPWKPAM